MCLTVKHICMADNGTGSVQFADDVIADKDKKRVVCAAHKPRST